MCHVRSRKRERLFLTSHKYTRKGATRPPTACSTHTPRNDTQPEEEPTTTTDTEAS